MSKRKFKKRKFKKKTGFKYVLSEIRKLKKVTKPEWKFVERILPATSITNTGITYELNLITQGIGDQQRVGRKVRAMKINCALRIVKGADPTNTFRYILMVDKRQESDTKFEPTGVLETLDTLSGIKVNRLEKFKIIRDRLILLRTNKIGVIHRFSHKLNFIMGYNGSASGDLEINGLYLMVLSDRASSFTSLEFNIRLYFTDV